jgi:hypothetical protein
MDNETEGALDDLEITDEDDESMGDGGPAGPRGKG